jgi:deoxycytidine triphosphate deaminase
MLNAEQIIEQGLLKLDHTHGKPAQVGYDLSLKAVNKIGNRVGPNMYSGGKIGKVLKDKTELTTYTPLDTTQVDGAEGWMLHPGTYDITFNEGCKIPHDLTAFIKQRSSLWRNGTLINSPVFDPGFETNFMGTIMLVTEPIFIEKDARVAQIYFHESTLTDNLYNGQWQNDKQRQ